MRIDSPHGRASALLLAVVTGWALCCGIARAEDPDPAVLIGRLEQPETSNQARRDLLAMGDRAIPAMVAGLESANAGVRLYLISVLGAARAEKAIAPLVRIAQSKEYNEASAALDALGRIGGPEAVDAIVAALPKLHPTGQEDYCRVLGAIGDNRAIAPLAGMLKAREGQKDGQRDDRYGEGIFRVRAREAAAEALGHFRDPRARAALEAAIREDPDWEVYHVARQAILRMDGTTSYPDYEKLAALVFLAVVKEPEPAEGAEQYIRNWHQQNPNWQGAWVGPRLEDYASRVDIERARKSVVENGKAWSPDRRAGGVVELLMEYLCSKKIPFHTQEEAKLLLIQIGKPALPALENGVKRGDQVLVRNCRECIEAINAARAADVP